MKKLVIGIDIGGINTVLGLVDRTGEVYARSSFRTAEYPFFDDYPAYVEMLVRTLRELCAAMPAGAVLSGIGIGAPNANYHTGRIERPVNLWKFRSGEPNPEEGRRFFSLCKEVGNSFPGIPVRITNDANAAALGEIAYGNAGGMRDFIMVTLGTGLGSGFVAGGRMIYGHDGMAGELGHVVVEPGGRQCGCGRRGCLETYVSATGIKRTVFELMARETVPSVLRDVPFSGFDARMITEAAQKGDPLALEAFRYTAQMLARALADAVAVTSPEAVFLFGGLAQAGDFLLEPVRRYLDEKLLYVYRGNVKVLPSGIPAQNAAILGASALIWNE
uniref:ROK family protein n=1 Tax=Alistipes putredinis TaxID=28117 RepID=UPI003FD71A85